MSNGLFDGMDVLDHVIDAYRNSYVFAVRTGSGTTPVDLYRANGQGGAPVLEGPLTLSTQHARNNGNPTRLILREYANEPAPEPDLTIDPNSGSGAGAVRDYIDLDSFTVAGSRPVTEFTSFGLGNHLCPDRRYTCFIQSSTPDGVRLFPWDVAGASLFVETESVGVTFANDDEPHLYSSESGHLIFVNHGQMNVLYFPVSEAGND